MIIKKICRKIIYNLHCIFLFFYLFTTKLFYKNRIYILGTPIYGNLGDQAITLAEEKLLKDNFENWKIIEIESIFTQKHIKYIRKFIKDSLILINGGGFMGSLWIKEEEMVRTVVKNFPNNPIIIFPQTLLYEDNPDGIKELNKSKEIYSNHKKLYIFSREKVTYDFIKENLPDCKTYLVPDIVLYLKEITKERFDYNQVTICMRNDKEKMFDDKKIILDILKDNGYTDINITDTLVFNNVYRINRKQMVYKKIYEFNKSKLIITDRLHGMIFAYLANTPCIVINSKSHKLKGVYEWIKDCMYIYFLDNENQLSTILKSLDNKKIKTSNKPKLDFSEIIDLISKNIKK